MNKVIGKDYRLYANTVRLVAIEDEKIVYWSYDNGKYDWLHPSNIKRLNDIESTEDKEPTKPLYTTKMQEADILPSVGMECMVKRSHMDDFSYLGCYIIGYSQDKCWLVFEDSADHLSYHNIKNGTFTFAPLLPIDTRTDEEKALDNLMDAYWDDKNEKLSRHSPIVKTILKAIKAGKVHNVTWSK